MPTVKIDVTVPLQTWHPLLGPTIKTPPSPQYTDARFTCPEDPPLGPNRRAYVEVAEQRRIVVRGEVDIIFRFLDPAGEGVNDAAGFRPVGISFYKQTTERWPAHHRHVDDDLPRQEIGYGHETAGGNRPFRVPFLKVRATWKTPRAKWKYMIVIQDLQGNIGVIDPTIENDADPA